MSSSSVECSGAACARLLLTWRCAHHIRLLLKDYELSFANEDEGVGVHLLVL